MQTLPTAGGRGVVQWVVPKNQRQNKKTLERVSYSKDIDIKEASDGEGDETFAKLGLRTSHHSDSDRSSHIGIIKYHDTVKPLVMDITICRTICSFIEQHLLELRDQQSAIDKARSNKSICLNLYNQNSIDNLNRLPNELSNIRIRDEQTKAIASIKQLTNYLRELTLIEHQCNCEGSRVDEEIVTKISNSRAQIIQALNDFILSNSDFDGPILDFEDTNANEYDLCVDAPAITRNNPNHISQLQKQTKDFPKILREANCNHENEQVYDHQQSILVETHTNSDKRWRDVVKLERDVEEMRNLFSEFYNLVKTQGEQLDTIEDNIVITAQRVSEGQHNLNKAKKSLTILMPVTGCMAGALIGGPVGLVIGGKLGGITIGCVTSLLGLISSYSVQRCFTPSKIKSD